MADQPPGRDPFLKVAGLAQNWHMEWPGGGRKMTALQRWKCTWQYARLMNNSWKRGMAVLLEAHTDPVTVNLEARIEPKENE